MPATVNPAIANLMQSVTAYVVEHGGYVTKTKLLKLLYLFDVEYFRTHREIFSGFGWKFFHLGPWAREFDEVLQSLVNQGALIETPSFKPEYDTKFLRASEPSRIDGVFNSAKDSIVLKAVLSTWGDKSTGEILDYVYFRTEPMEHGVRNQPLDFTRIRAELPTVYSRSSSGMSRKEIAETRKKFWGRKKAPSEDKGKVMFTPPNYDDEYFQAIAKLDGRTR